MHRDARFTGPFQERVTIERPHAAAGTVVVTRYTSGQQRRYGDSVCSGTIESDNGLNKLYAIDYGRKHIRDFTQVKGNETDWAGWTMDMHDAHGDGRLWLYEVVQVWLD